MKRSFFAEHGTFVDGRRVPAGSAVGLTEGSCVVFGQSMLEFVLSRVGASQQGSRRPAAHKRRSEERRSGRQSPPGTAGSSGSRPGSPQHQSKSLSKKRCRDTDARRDSGQHSDHVSSGTASPSSSHSSNSAKELPTAPKTVRWSPDLARVHEVPGVDYPPDYFEATEQAVIIRNMFVASVGGSDDEDDDPIANSVSESPVSSPALPAVPSV